MFKIKILRWGAACAFLAAGFFVRADGPPPIPSPSPVRLITLERAEKLVQAKKVVVLDVRTEEEFKEGHIKGATNINFLAGDFERKLSGLNKSKPYLVHCAAGNRSAKVVKQMEKMEFKTILHLDCGFSAWEKAGKEIVKN